MNTAPSPAPAIPAAYFGEKVTHVHHWTDRLFSFRCTRDTAFRFRAGEFAMIGLMVDGKPLVRAYSVASPTWDEALEFLSIKVQNGPLTSPATYQARRHGADWPQTHRHAGDG